jgi:hypothetical protein
MSIPAASLETQNVTDTPQEPDTIIIDSIFAGVWKAAEDALKKNIPALITKLTPPEISRQYNILLFLDQSNSINEDHADRIYTAINAFKEKKDILLILGSRGGQIEPAYLISKNRKAASNKRFVIAVPRRAKSAATLISLGADEIHMGGMSELGPIDPQFGGLPALSLSNALQTLAKLVETNPGSSNMFAAYLSSKLDLGILGYFERINDSAVQYASRLLQGKQLPDGQTANTLAAHMVNYYKDHSFVIDKDEATTLFGSDMVKVQTTLYSFSNELDQRLRFISRLAKWINNKEVTFVGSTEECLKIRDIKTK